MSKMEKELLKQMYKNAGVPNRQPRYGEDKMLKRLHKIVQMRAKQNMSWSGLGAGLTSNAKVYKKSVNKKKFTKFYNDYKKMMKSNGLQSDINDARILFMKSRMQSTINNKQRIIADEKLNKLVRGKSEMQDDRDLPEEQLRKMKEILLKGNGKKYLLEKGRSKKAKDRDPKTDLSVFKAAKPKAKRKPNQFAMFYKKMVDADKRAGRKPITMKEAGVLYRSRN